MHALFFTLGLLALGATSGAGQDSLRIVSPDQALVTPALPYPVVEPHLAVRPGAPTHLVAAAMVVESTDWQEAFAISCYAFASFDAGATWNAHRFDQGNCGDPWVAINPDGSAVFTGLGEVDRVAGIYAYRSPDGGRTWASPPTVLPGAHDHQTMTVVPAGAGQGLYLVSGLFRRLDEGVEAGIFVSRSGDGGRTFEERAVVVPSNLNQEARNPVVLEDGTLLVPYGDHSTITDGRRLERRREWMLASEDGGRTFAPPRFVTEACGRDRPVSWPSIAAGPAPGGGEHVYHICEAPGNEGIILRRSSDAGRSWRGPVRVDASRPRNPHTRTPALAVASDGTVGVAWYDGSGASFHECQVLRFAVSTDGGESFATETQLSQEPSCPFTNENGDAAWRWPTGGDYIGLVSTGPSAFRVVWADSRNGRYELRTAAVSAR